MRKFCFHHMGIGGGGGGGRGQIGEILGKMWGVSVVNLPRINIPLVLRALFCHTKSLFVACVGMIQAGSCVVADVASRHPRLFDAKSAPGRRREDAFV